MKREIGKVSATEKVPNTVDYFHFWTDRDVILKPFDVIVVDQIKDSLTFAVVEEINHVTDTPSFLSAYVGSDFGNIDVETFSDRLGFNYIKASVTGNTKSIFNPVIDGKKVRLATADEVKQAYGLDEIKNPVCAGYFQMYSEIGAEEKVIVPVNIDRKDLIGPEAAHLNIAGISGLATKTSYAAFLIKNLQDVYKSKKEDDKVSYIVFNVKGQDLLHLDEPSKDKKLEEQKDIYKELNIEPTPLENVNYLYPYSKLNKKLNAQTECDKTTLKKQFDNKIAKTFAFTYEDSRELIELFYSSVEDTTGTMESILQVVEENDAFNLADWDSFRTVLHERMQAGGSRGKEIPVASWRKFSRLISKNINNNIFRPNLSDGVDLFTVIQEISSGQITVIDISHLNESIQSFVFGVVLKAVNRLRSGDSDHEHKNTPKKVVIFMDELNKYASKDIPKNSPILREILDVTERGRSLGIVLFGAEQFKSSIHDRVTGNCANNVFGRSNSVELSTRGYSYINRTIKSLLTRLSKGELVLQSPKFRQMMKINFPFPSYHQPKD